MLNKKAFSATTIIAFATLLVMLILIPNFLSKGESSSSDLQCKIQMEYLESLDSAIISNFLSGSDKFSNKVKDLIEKSCESQNVSITPDNVRPAVNLVKSCWLRSGSGTDILNTENEDLGFCMYCGRIDSNSEINDFNTKFVKALEEDSSSSFLLESSDVKNLNREMLFTKTSISPDIGPENPKDVFFFIYKPVGESKSISGVRIDNIGEGIRNGESQTYIGNTNQDGKFKCTNFIIP